MEACEDVYACGDIVRFPLPLVGTTASIGHWQIAHNHGNMLYYIISFTMISLIRSYHSIKHTRKESEI